MIYAYDNYRTYLKSVLAQKKAQNPRFSERAFSRFLDLNPAHLNLLLRGKKNISQEVAVSISEKLNLSEIEKDYFCTLVALETTKNLNTKTLISKRLERIYPKFQYHTLELDQFCLISDWYHYAIIEMTQLQKFKNNPSWIATQLSISKEEVEIAIDRLLRLKILENKNGKLVKKNPFLITRSEEHNDALQKFHTQTLQYAQKALKEQPSKEREFGSITMSIDPSKLKAAKEKMKQFRLEMAKFLSEGPKTQTYQLSMQLFKLTTGEKK